MLDKNKNLYYLDELPEYKIAAPGTDIRGWSVVDVNNKLFGHVSNLLVNKQSQRVVYIEVRVDDERMVEVWNTHRQCTCEGLENTETLDGAVYVVVPIGMVHLIEQNNQVFITQNCSKPTKTIYSDFINHNEYRFEKLSNLSH